MVRTASRFFENSRAVGTSIQVLRTSLHDSQIFGCSFQPGNDKGICFSEWKFRNGFGKFPEQNPNQERAIPNG
jgi:hypothetical protein